MPIVTQVETNIACAQIVDACMRLKVPFRIAPPGIKPVAPRKGMIFGPAIPVRHYGSVDVFLEVLEHASYGGIIVIDNLNRKDEACIGDLTVIETMNAGMKAMVVWGLHRDTSEITDLDFPVFSYGAYPAGPAGVDVRDNEAFNSARFGDFIVTKDDTVFADQDGVLFVETDKISGVLATALSIRNNEVRQSKAAMQGTSLREQFQFSEFLKQRKAGGTQSFRQHLASIAKAIEE